MEPTLGLLGGGGRGSGVSSETKSSLTGKKVVEEGGGGGGGSELELGLSLGGAKYKGSASWGRILTAKDFPCVNVSGSKRPASQNVPSVSQVVGWPPIRAYRMNNLVNQAKAPTTEEDKIMGEYDKTSDDKNNNNDAREKAPLGFVKVNMDGLPIGRKVDLKAHVSYETLAATLEDMFFRPTTTISCTRSGGEKEPPKKTSKLLDGSSEFVLTYEDKDGDWLLVGDVPWGMFLSTVKRLRIMRTSDANGLAPRSQDRNQRQRS